MLGYSSNSHNYLSEDETSKVTFIVKNTPVLDKDINAENYRRLALLHSQNGQADLAVEYILKYVSETADLSFINDHVFQNIKNTSPYLAVKERYRVKLNFLSGLYIFAGFLGFFIFIALCLKKDAERTSTILMGLFVLFHSLFILHLCIYVINSQYWLPQMLFVSTTFSFLYGPILYFYFKRTIFNHKFKWQDVLHLIPSLVLFLYIAPYYMLSGLEKFQITFNQDNFLLPGANIIITVKIISLTVYAFFIFRMYKGYTKGSKSKSKNKILWQRNIISFFIIYIFAYIIYAGTITEIVTYAPLMHIQILVMVALVFYVAYVSYVQPEVFRGEVVLGDPVNLFKYSKSRLTPSYSTELKENLIRLLDNEKIYKENNINLEVLSQKLGTNRHNASQVINEHFNMNFFELINTYRINEALEILKGDKYQNLNIIEVAYEVGFNNKVTFNKSFKKILSQTPTQYLNTLRAS